MTAPPTAPASDELARLASDLAMAAGALARDGRRGLAGAGAVSTKSTVTDMVTVHDRAAEALIVGRLDAERPADAIVGEEGTARDGTTGLAWFIDPIDGTTNFVYGIPQWSTSVAVADAEGTLAGAVYVPEADELFAAARGRGATLNGEPIGASATTRLALALVATGFAYSPERRGEQAAHVAALITEVRDIRRFGSAAVDLCYAAAGRVDAYYEEHLNSWDMAAGELIAREAGCRTGDFAGGRARAEQLLAAAPGIFDDLRALLSRVVLKGG